MKFNPLTKRLFTDEGHFIKRLSCPRRASRQQMTPARDRLGILLCAQCDKNVYETRHLTDNEVQQLLEETPGACLAIRADQENITLTRS